MIGRYARNLSVGLILIGLVGLYEYVQKVRDDRAFMRAITVSATPEVKPAKGQSYSGDLVFRTESGETVTIAAKQVPTSIRDSFRFVKDVQIQYLPQAPSKVRFVDWSVKAESKDLAVSALLFGVGVLAFAILRKSRE